MASTASSDTASIRLIITGVASTGTRPLPMRGAVWASATTSSAWPCRPIGRSEKSTMRGETSACCGKSLPPDHALELGRRQIHRASRTRLDARQMDARLRQHAFGEETADDELGVHAVARAVGAGCELGLGGFRHAGPHVAERDQTEQVHVVGRTRPGIVGFAERILGEPHGRLLEVPKRPLEWIDEGTERDVVGALLHVGLHLAEERRERAAAVLGELAADQVERLDAVRALVDHCDAGIAHELLYARFPDVAMTAEHLLGYHRIGEAAVGQHAFDH